MVTLTEHQFIEKLNGTFDDKIKKLKTTKAALHKLRTLGFMPKYIGYNNAYHLIGVETYNKLTYEEVIEYSKRWLGTVPMKHQYKLNFSTSVNLSPPILAYHTETVEHKSKTYHFRIVGDLGKERYMLVVEITSDAYDKFYDEFRLKESYPKVYPFVSGAYITFHSINDMNLWVHQNIGIKSLMT